MCWHKHEQEVLKSAPPSRSVTSVWARGSSTKGACIHGFRAIRSPQAQSRLLRAPHISSISTMLLHCISMELTPPLQLTLQRGGDMTRRKDWGLDWTFSANGFASYWLQSISMSMARTQAESVINFINKNQADGKLDVHPDINVN